MGYKKFLKKIEGDKIGYESATPDIVSNFLCEDITKRLMDNAKDNIKDNINISSDIGVIDCCCGIGNVSIALSKFFNFVVAVDKDKERLKIAERNAKIYNCKNIKFIHSDIFSINIKDLKEKYNLNVAFADPQRRIIKDGKTIRTNNLTETSPNTINLINFITPEIPNMCVLTSSNAEVNLPCEKEYVSWQGRKGKRETLLVLYFGNLKKCEKSAVVLPSKDKICKETNFEKVECEKSEKPLKYIYEIKDCVVKAKLQNELGILTKCKIFNEKFLTSENEIKSNFFENRFEVLGICTQKNLIENLKKINARKVVIRGKIMPKEHKKMKNEIERKLDGGKEKIHIFINGKKILIGRNIDLKI